MAQPTSTRIKGPAIRPDPSPEPRSMVESERLDEAFARAAKPRKRAGSARAEKATSRAAPMPSKLEPVSRADSTVRNRASPNR